MKCALPLLLAGAAGFMAFKYRKCKALRSLGQETAIDPEIARQEAQEFERIRNEATRAREAAIADGLRTLAAKIDNLSLQTEEIYDLTQHSTPDSQLLDSLVQTCDLLDAYFRATEDGGAGIRKLAGILEGAKVTRFGEVGERLNPSLHNVVGVRKIENVDPELVCEVIAAGYAYDGKLLRKATVVVTGQQ